MRLRKILFHKTHNGISCLDILQSDNGFPLKVAHINQERSVEYFTELCPSDIQIIEEHAFFSNDYQTALNKKKVFNHIAPSIFDKREHKITREIYNSGIVYTGMTVDGEEITSGHDTYSQAATELMRELTGRYT